MHHNVFHIKEEKSDVCFAYTYSGEEWFVYSFKESLLHVLEMEYSEECVGLLSFATIVCRPIVLKKEKDNLFHLKNCPYEKAFS